jgi:hypothetical protein
MLVRQLTRGIGGERAVSRYSRDIPSKPLTSHNNGNPINDKPRPAGVDLHASIPP